MAALWASLTVEGMVVMMDSCLAVQKGSMLADWTVVALALIAVAPMASTTGAKTAVSTVACLAALRA
jgi:hypothetical protein